MKTIFCISHLCIELILRISSIPQEESSLLPQKQEITHKEFLI